MIHNSVIARNGSRCAEGGKGSLFRAGRESEGKESICKVVTYREVNGRDKRLKSALVGGEEELEEMFDVLNVQRRE